jgi:hypothetical protein
LSAADFVRVSTVQRLTRAGLRGIAPHVIALAEAEGLRGHAASIRVRETDASLPASAAKRATGAERAAKRAPASDDVGESEGRSPSGKKR